MYVKKVGIEFPEYQRRYPVFGPADAYKVDGSHSAESRLLRKRRSESPTTNSPLTVDVRAEMTALDIDEGVSNAELSN
ncbi:hypothetical protein TELCIR_13825 [Teladorsagia circumcincta]|uniref:Uncharacterized protein n=1 Tax=Teladorsagia circumcincta TaxID=45464 RepID=A0A2G9U2X7_TELCI|nr:hypothetical protein TELCIR_13825 [Teladorsagia circumcincta]